MTKSVKREEMPWAEGFEALGTKDSTNRPKILSGVEKDCQNFSTTAYFSGRLDAIPATSPHP